MDRLNNVSETMSESWENPVPNFSFSDQDSDTFMDRFMDTFMDRLMDKLNASSRP